MKYLLILLLLAASCRKEETVRKAPNWAATEYIMLYNTPNPPFTKQIGGWISAHFHNLRPEEVDGFKIVEAYGPYQLCPGDSTLSRWVVGIDTCK